VSTALQRTSLGELGYSSLTATSLGELSVAEQVLEFFFGAGDADDRRIEDELILTIIKAFIKRVS
jgi:hypothetical protein